MINDNKNLIVKLENENYQIELLAAQRQIYSVAKKWFMLQMSLIAIVPTILAGIASIKPDIKVYLVLFSMIVTLLDVNVIENIIKDLRTKAAQIQEKFDCIVLSLPVSRSRATTGFLPEDVIENSKAQIEKYGTEKLKDWYSPELSVLPIHVARIACQRTNCWWDGDLRKKVSSFLLFFMFSIIISIALLSVYFKTDSVSLLLDLGVFIPTIVFCIKQRQAQNDACSRLKDILKDAEKIYDDILNKKLSEEEATEKSRRLQDEIFDHRSKSPFILDFIYFLKRDQNELLMNKSSEQFASDAIKRMESSLD
ncbi:MAG: S-4TM family putative pore-forming effector [Candidatus Sericytochromatia bacterium]